MKEYRPQRMASKPYFLIAFTVLGIGYAIWMIYAAVILGQALSSYSVVFVLGVLVLLWYSRLTARFYVRIFDDRLEWKMRRNEKVALFVKDIEAVYSDRNAIEIIANQESYTLLIEAFDPGEERIRIRRELKAWFAGKGIAVEE